MAGKRLSLHWRYFGHINESDPLSTIYQSVVLGKPYGMSNHNVPKQRSYLAFSIVHLYARLEANFLSDTAELVWPLLSSAMTNSVLY